MTTIEQELEQLKAALARAEADYVKTWTRPERDKVSAASDTAGKRPSASTRGKLTAALRRLDEAEARQRDFFKHFILEGKT